jgi:hypothetical protein
MADITVTAANVRPYSGYAQKAVTAGGTVTAGQLVYKDTSDSNEYKAADCSAYASSVIAGIALTNAADGEQLIVQTSGYVNPGGTVTVAQVYIGSTNAGGIAPVSDHTSGNYMCVFGIGITSSKIYLSISSSTATKP